MFQWLKKFFSRKDQDGNPESAVKTVIVAAQHTADFLTEHQEQFEHAQKLVLTAEAAYKAQPKSGKKKWAFVISAMESVWVEIKPHVISILAGIAVDLLKEELKKTVQE